MKHAKKLLALFLSLTLALSLALPATAEFDAAGGESVPTHITAEWNGKVALDSFTMRPYLDSRNVTITVYFEEGEPEVLTNWGGRIEGVGTGEVTVTYDGMQASFIFPNNFIELYIAQQEEIPELLLGKQQHEFVAAFTPPRSREYHFVATGSRSSGDQTDYRRILILNSDMEVVADGARHLTAELTAGKTYYVLGCQHVTDWLRLSDRLELGEPEWLSALFGGFAFFGFWVGLPFLAIVTAPITMPIVWITELIQKLKA